MSLLSTILEKPPWPDQNLLIFQSSIAQSSLPVLRQLISRNLDSGSSASHGYFILFFLLYQPSSLLELENVTIPSNQVEIHNWVSQVLGYVDDWSDPRERIFSIVKNAPPGSVNVIIDSIDTLSADVGSTPETYQFLRTLHGLIQARSGSSRLILHALQPSKILPLLIQTAFSPSLVHLTVHPTVLLSYLAKDYLTPPPPASSDAKFWGVFLPVSEQGSDSLVFGADGEGHGRSLEMVIEVLFRGINIPGKKRGIERVLEGWSLIRGACDLTVLESLKGMAMKQATEEHTSDPTQNLSFNLSLTSSQQESRAQVPLPYAHEGRPLGTSATIVYDPDSADDIDDDDPDEDLDI